MSQGINRLPVTYPNGEQGDKVRNQLQRIDFDQAYEALSDLLIETGAVCSALSDNAGSAEVRNELAAIADRLASLSQGGDRTHIRRATVLEYVSRSQMLAALCYLTESIYHLAHAFDLELSEGVASILRARQEGQGLNHGTSPTAPTRSKKRRPMGPEHFERHV